MNKDKQTHGIWNDLIDAELATIDAKGDAAAVANVADHYAQLDLDAPLVQTIKRNSSDPTVAANLAPSLIGVYIKQRDLKALTQVLRTFKMGDVSPPLRPSAHLALARAYTLMRQFPRAADQWKSLLKSPCSDEIPWEELAQFVATCGGIRNLRDDIHERLQRQSHLKPVALLTSLLVDVDAGVEPKDDILEQIGIKAIERHDLLFDLALTALRLGEYAYAAKAAKRGLKLRPGWQPLENLLSTIDSFRGNSVQKLEPLRMDQEGIDAIRGAAEDVSETEYGWGLLIREPNGSFAAICQFLSDSEDREMNLATFGSTAVATFSILPQLRRTSTRDGTGTRRMADPMEVLPYLDWELPHLMYQRRGKSGLLHAFVRANEVQRDWWFCPRCLQPSNSHSSSNEGRANEDPKRMLWKQATLELGKLYLKETKDEPDHPKNAIFRDQPQRTDRKTHRIARACP